MKWKILAGLDILFSTVGVLAALVLGNGIFGRHVPALKDNATWLSKLIVKGLLVPDNLVTWALGEFPALLIILVFAVCIGSEWLLVVFSPLVDRLAALAASQRFGVALSLAHQELTRNRNALVGLRRQMSRRVMTRVVEKSLVALVIGLCAGAIAWGVAALINLNTGGVLQTITAVIAILVLLFINDFLGEIFKEAVQDDEATEALRDRVTNGAT